MADFGTKGMVGEEWYTCAVCDCNFPRSKVVVQLGRIVCCGSGTHRCFDAPGRDHFVRRTMIDNEENPAPLPMYNEDI